MLELSGYTRPCEFSVHIGCPVRLLPYRAFLGGKT